MARRRQATLAIRVIAVRGGGDGGDSIRDMSFMVLSKSVRMSEGSTVEKKTNGNLGFVFKGEVRVSQDKISRKCLINCDSV